MEFLEQLIALFVSLAGFAAFITFVVNLMKSRGWIKDGLADKWVKYLNLAGLVIVGIMYFAYPGAITIVDQVLGSLAQLGGILLPAVALGLGWPLANGISGKVHNGVRGFPLLGTSNK